MVRRDKHTGLPTAPPPPEPAVARLLAQPIEFLFADHARQRSMLSQLEWLAGEGGRSQCAEIAQSALEFLCDDLPTHVLDEEEDLFPLLHRRCVPDDQAEAILTALSAEHAADEILARTVVDAMRGLAMSSIGGVDLGLRIPIRAFVGTQRRHLAWENALVLPLASKRLTPEDLDHLASRMAARRGIAAPGSGPRRFVRPAPETEASGGPAPSTG